MKVQYYTKHNYGVPMEYVADATIAKNFEKILNKKTISAKIRYDLAFLGIEFEEVIAPKI